MIDRDRKNEEKSVKAGIYFQCVYWVRYYSSFQRNRYHNVLVYGKFPCKSYTLYISVTLNDNLHILKTTITYYWKKGATSLRSDQHIKESLGV